MSTSLNYSPDTATPHPSPVAENHQTPQFTRQSIVSEQHEVNQTKPTSPAIRTSDKVQRTSRSTASEQRERIDKTTTHQPSN